MSVDAPATREHPFTGYGRSDGSVGIRNRVLVLPSVICSHLVAEQIAARDARAVAAPHDHGCGQLGEDNDQTARVLRNVAANPNIAGCLVVGLGCEKVQSADLAATIEGRDVPVREISIQAAGGSDACIERGTTAVHELSSHVTGADPVPADLGELTIGVVVDALDAETVSHAYPVIAGLLDRTVAAGGRVVLAGNERFVAHPEAARDHLEEQAQEAFSTLLDTHAEQPARARAVAASAASRGATAAIGFLGDTPIDDVVPYGTRADTSGVTLIDAPSRFEEAATGLAAAGAHVVVHVTGDGIPAGHPIVPVVKVSGREETLSVLGDDIDIDARETTPADLVSRLRDIADGASVRAEEHGLTEFAIARAGPSI